MQDFRTIIEPFRIKAVEPIPWLTADARCQALERAGHNLFRLSAEEVTIDLLTDSGTGAMSAQQWAALMQGDESYAGSRSFARFQEVVQRLTGYRHVFPVHQGRAAERILARTLLRPGQVVLNNTHFDTTRANLEQAGARAIDVPVPAASDPDSAAPFKGDLDLDRLDEWLVERRAELALVMVTLTNNAAGGQPVSMANLRAVSRRCREAGIPLLLDAARFAENAWFVHTREPGYASRTVEEIAREAFDLADGCTLSAKKDGISHTGGLLAFNREDWAEPLGNELILGEGFLTYGGLAGRDLEAIAVGLEEALEPGYLRYRARSVAYLSEGLERVGVPVVRPPGGHAVFVNAGRLLSHLSPQDLPGQVLATAFYLEGGVRGVEVGEFMFPGAALQLLRLALPRRVYTQAHMDYVVEVAERVAARAATLPGYRILRQPPFLRHFSATLEPARSPHPLSV